MKKILLFLWLCSYSLHSYAQERHTIGVFRSFPTGKFGSSHLDGGGFAKSGWGFLLENNAKPKSFAKWLSLATRFSYQKNEIDTKGLARKFTEVLGYETRISDAAYEPITLLVGPQIELPLRRKLHLQLKSGFGVMFTKVNAFNITVFDPQGAVLFEDVLDGSGNIPFAYMGGVQLRQGITEKISVNLFTEYTSAKGKMGSKLGKIRIKPSEFDISTLSLGLSLRFDF
ncbi:hypothetical protein [Dyadobacter sp. LHD-138]|uniref:hypothetical protein n=1 Tax=Dyadobacter sp. LHD-138 TaxID=3071413 RepID=UPI0027DEF0B3|nr:hypothetical protein [Dyadobacter sp. LHD-138]MDQ6482026.1 hypothetical protein [Dyadobacter sp. LHD-138]